MTKPGEMIVKLSLLKTDVLATLIPIGLRVPKRSQHASVHQLVESERLADEHHGPPATQTLQIPQTPLSVEHQTIGPLGIGNNLDCRYL